MRWTTPAAILAAGLPVAAAILMFFRYQIVPHPATVMDGPRFEIVYIHDRLTGKLKRCSYLAVDLDAFCLTVYAPPGKPPYGLSEVLLETAGDDVRAKLKSAGFTDREIDDYWASRWR